MKNIIDKGFAAGGKIAGGRDYQEDAFSFCELNSNAYLLILADGMGGHVGGARASALAVSGFESFINHDNINDTSATLKSALRAANDAIRNDIESNPENKSMGCTLIGAVIINNLLFWISVGDSPLWLLRDGEITRLNADHSMRPVLESLVALGRMSEAELQTDNRINQLRSVVNGEDVAIIDSKDSFPLQQGDKIILASDGVETLSDAEIIRLSTSEVTTETVSCLLDEIETINKPSQDNATVVVYPHKMQAALAGEMEIASEVPSQTKTQPGKAKKAWSVERWSLAIIGVLVLALALSIGIPMHNEWQAEKIAMEARRIADEQAEAERTAEEKRIADERAEAKRIAEEKRIAEDVNAEKNDNRTPLHPAAWKGHSEVIKVLLKHNADVNAKAKDGSTPLDIAIEQGKDGIAEILRHIGGRCNKEC